MNPIRSFIAFPLPEPTLAHLRSFQEALREAGLDDLRHVRPETIHLTLRFLGDVDPSRVEAIASAMAEAGSETAPMTLATRGVGVFPGRAAPGWSGPGCPGIPAPSRISGIGSAGPWNPSAFPAKNGRSRPI